MFLMAFLPRYFFPFIFRDEETVVQSCQKLTSCDSFDDGK